MDKNPKGITISNELEADQSAICETVPAGDFLKLLATSPFDGGLYLHLLDSCTAVPALSPKQIPDLIASLELIRHLLKCTTTAAFDWHEAQFMSRTKAHFLLIGLIEELEALARGAHSPVLRPITSASSSSARKKKQVHPAHLRLKEECAAAVEVLSDLTRVPKDDAKKLVADVVAKRFAGTLRNGFGAKAIEAQATQMRKQGSMSQAVRGILYNAFPEVFDDDRPAISRADWIRQSLSNTEICRAVLDRVAETAERAARTSAPMRVESAENS